MEASSPATARRAPKKVVPLQLTTTQDSTTRKCYSLTTPPASAVSATITTRTRTSSGRLSPAQIASFKTKIKTYSTDTNAAYTRSRAFLSFLNNIEHPLRSDPLQIPQSTGGLEGKENLKIPVHINVMKKGSFGIPSEIPLSPTSLIFECELAIEHPRLVSDGGNLDIDLEPPSSTSLIFTVEVNFLDGTADIVPLSPIPPKVDSTGSVAEEECVEDDDTTPTAPSLRRTGSHRQNRSGGWYMKSPETGLFANIGA